jgi:hypothetical protein
MQGIVEGEQKNIRAKVQFVPDTKALALHRKTLLVIRSCIIPHSYSLSLCVSHVSDNKGDTLCLPRGNLTLALCCNQAASTPPLVFCQKVRYHSRIPP